MSVELPPAFEGATRLLLHAEQTIALVARATPRNAHAELERLTAADDRLDALAPRFRYASPPDLSDVRRSLERLAAELGRCGSLGTLYVERARELDLEASLAESIGTPELARLSLARFPEPSPAISAELEEFVRHALKAPVPATESALHDSGDFSDAKSVASQVRRIAFELGLSLRVELRPAQLATAATGEGLVAVRPGVRVGEDASRRIALHELFGHALPRERSRLEPVGLFRAGTARSGEFEEGRALLIEARARLLDAARARELALRHLAAESVRRGATFPETVMLLKNEAEPRSRALEIAARVHRGGGLAREFSYLPSYLELSHLFETDPGLERIFERGRVSVEAARVLRAIELDDGAERGARRAGYVENSINTGA